jgi:hypothetical protein
MTREHSSERVGIQGFLDCTIFRAEGTTVNPARPAPHFGVAVINRDKNEEKYSIKCSHYLEFHLF